ncbi:type II toxin-antitoxin system MqsR family toxin [Pseudomonas neuropathica]|jgi:motility quorum-sensing regulator/GCU-specific mRNA interferase toxin|uniref:Type II toxin-antitoxin system MqsR family toxin n=2 Tax=Pseudomonas TaxID=286 RepID=A0ABX8YT15_9PSED|nr:MULTISPECIES: type II toxin-antitoxin system MqsR family toxin [Pseudomonas]PIF51339.1 motility quorum-sensing regulator/GCU-specific mRNA interferase toxin [Pseudomonas sp. 29]QYY83034.1 type II toxin-antitoxin system MqsR family toxin [Pseudomonas germanica]UVL35786.1 type II toxin-antitoxin system MqsR family toxin [Pseudomonas sp. B21-041]
MEKNTPHYELAVIKAEVRRLGRRAFTRSSAESGDLLGFSIREMQEIVYELQNRMLYKSMTSYDDHRVWQDVYHTHSQDLEIYIKVTYRPAGGAPVISFKEKNP